MMKVCIICNVSLSLTSFHQDKSRHDGLNPRCKTCKSGIDSEYRKKNKTKISEHQKVYYQENAEKIKERSFEWYNHNSDKRKADMKVYYHTNKQKIKEKQKIWDETNKEKMKEYNKNYFNTKYKTNIQYRVKSAISSRMRDCIKKKHGALVYIGCSIDVFINWIEYQFDCYMSWENYGSYWHLDHVLPCSSFNLSREEEVFKCFNWKNMRPLEGRQNISKSNKIDTDVIEYHKGIVRSFITERTKEHQALAEKQNSGMVKIVSYEV